MWAVHESYDPAERVLTLDLVAGSSAPKTGARGPLPTLLGTFPSLDEARRFMDGYLKTASHGADRVVTRVDWGSRFA